MKKERDRSRRFAALREEISQVKADREEYLRLERQGRSMQSLQQDIIDIKESIAHLGLVLDYLAKRRDAWKQAERETRGLCPLEAEITSIKAQHKAYRAEFKSPSAIARRRAEHRAGWIQEHRRDSPPS